MVPDVRLGPAQFKRATSPAFAKRSIELTAIDRALQRLDADWGAASDDDKRSLLAAVIRACFIWNDLHENIVHTNLFKRKREEQVNRDRLPLVKAAVEAAVEQRQALEGRAQWRDSESDNYRAHLEKKAFKHRVVSPGTMTRLEWATRAIQYVNNEVFIYGAGNQKDDIRRTGGIASVRTQELRLPSNRRVDKSGPELLAEGSGLNPGAEPARQAMLARYWHAGACDDYSNVTFNFLREKLSGTMLTRCAAGDLHHAFVIVGDLANDSDQELVVADPWPTEPQACTWADFFGHSARDQIRVKVQMVADGEDGVELHKHQLRITKKKGHARDEGLDAAALGALETRQDATHDLWTDRYTVKGDRPIVYALSDDADEVAAATRRAWRDIQLSRHLPDKALKRLGR